MLVMLFCWLKHRKTTQNKELPWYSFILDRFFVVGSSTERSSFTTPLFLFPWPYFKSHCIVFKICRGTYAVFTRDAFTWGKLTFLLYCVTFSIVKWHLPHVNVSRVNTALYTLYCFVTHVPIINNSIANSTVKGRNKMCIMVAKQNKKIKNV